jgi:ABC-type multidrug transport system ATPase subunit
MNSEKLFYSRGLYLEGGYVLKDVSVLSGDVVWVNSDNPVELDVFIAFLLGLVKIEEGNANISGRKIKDLPHNIVSYFDIVNWHPKLASINDLVNILAHSRGLQSSFVLNEFKRLLNGIGAGYAVNLSLDKMTRSTKIMLSTALVMSMPSLIMLLVEPFEVLDKEASIFLDAEIKNLANDGSSIFILSGTEPIFYNKSIKVGIKE